MRDLTEEEKNLEKRDPESEVLDEEGARRLRETQRHIFFFLNPQADQILCKMKMVDEIVSFFCLPENSRAE